MAPSQPVQAFNYLSGRSGRIFTEYTWGDYSIARHRATFVDGRTDLFEGKVLTEFFAITNMTTNPDPILSSYHVSYRRLGAADVARPNTWHGIRVGVSSTAAPWPWSSPGAESVRPPALMDR